MQLRYSFRLYPSAGQRTALARAFGCARVVFNDALRARENARAAGLPFVAVRRAVQAADHRGEADRRSGPGSARCPRSCCSSPCGTWTPRTGTSSTASRASGPKMGAAPVQVPQGHPAGDPVHRQRPAGRSPTGGKLRLPKVGDVKVKWSRSLPSTPSTVTVIKDAPAGTSPRFVVETEPGRRCLPRTRRGRHRPGTDALRRPVRRHEDRQPRASCAGPRRSSRRRSRTCPARPRDRRTGRRPGVKVARAHARVADARREFHHQLSTKLIRDNQAVPWRTWR